jgi:nitrile hydratase accessory protein
MPSSSIFGKTISNQGKPMPDPEPVFAEPWEAHAFALAVKLSEAGLFTWSEWSAALAEELAAASRRGEPDDGSRDYHHWLAALERLVAVKNLVGSLPLLARKEEWAAAYRRTPHGSPVTLEATPHPSPLPARGEREAPAPAGG